MERKILMILKFCQKIGQFLKENIKMILGFIVIFIILTFEFPYYIETPGGIIDTTSRFDLESSYSSKGSLNLAYVGQLRATLPLLLYSKINSDWKLIPKKEVVLENETVRDVEFRDRLMLDEANNTAIKLAYQKAGKPYKILESKLYITYIDKLAKTNLKVQDQILMIDNQIISNSEQMHHLIAEHSVGDVLKIKVLHNGKEYTRTAQVIEYENVKMIGVVASTSEKIETTPSIQIQFKNSESGPSGGLMMTLSIYNSLISKDITKGYKIVGTGTIQEDGTVGSIDGVEYKLMGAVKEKADIFLVPDGENYQDAYRLKQKKNYNIEIVPVKTLEEAINYLTKKE